MADTGSMGGVEGAGGARVSRWDDRYDQQGVTKDSAAHAVSPRGALASAPWANDGAAIPDAVQNYDPAMFANPALRGAAPVAVAVAAAARPSVARAPDPLPSAADSYRGIRLACLADDLPPMTRTDRASVVRAGAYTLQPAVRVHEDGSASLLYWTAVNREMKRAEFVVGPESLEAFKANVTSYERAGATAYLQGEPNEWQRLSLKTIDDAMRHGPLAAAGTLKSAWSAAVRDPSWWAQNMLAATTAVAGAGALSRGEAAAAEESTAARTARGPTTPTAHTPVVEGGGLRAHEGGAAKGHLIERHVGKTPAELEARFAKSKRLQASSSFYDRAQAEAAAAKTLAANETTTSEWLGNAGGKSRLELEYHPRGPAFPVGMHVKRGADAAPVAGVRLVLVKDVTTSTGFRILTGFPIP